MSIVVHASTGAMKRVFEIATGEHSVRAGRHRIEGALYLPGNGAGHCVVSPAGGTLNDYLQRVPESLVEKLWPHGERQR